jgi:uncharacterized protein (TIRG00374 family)
VIVAEILFNEDLKSFEVFMQDTYKVIRKYKWKILTTFAVAAFLIFAMTFLIGFDEVITTLKKAKSEWIIFNFIIEAIITLVWTARWKMILDVVDTAPKFRTLYMMLLASLFGNNVTPSAAGGEPLRAYLLKEIEGTPFEIGFATSTADRVFEFLPFILISIIAALFVLSWKIPPVTQVLVIVMIIFSISLFGILIYAGLRKEMTQKIIISIAKSIYPTVIRLTKQDISFNEIREKIVVYINRFSTGFLTALKDRDVFLVAFLLSFAMWGLDMLRMYVCFGALGVYPPLVPLVIIYTIGILISLLPLLPGAWGIREGTLIALFAVVGVSADVVMAASLIDRLASYIVPTIIGAIAALYYGQKVKNKNNFTPLNN